MTESPQPKEVGPPGRSDLLIPDVEMNIAVDISKRSWILFVPAIIALGVWRGPDAALAVFLAGALVIANLFIAAEISRVCAGLSPTAIMAGALSGFTIRLIIVFVAALIIRNFSVIDFKVWLLSVAIGHIALLAWETRHISFSLGHPGVKPDSPSGSSKAKN